VIKKAIALTIKTEWMLGLILLAVSLSFVPSFMHPFGVLKYIVLRFGILLFLVFIPFSLRSTKWNQVDIFLFTWLIGLGASALIFSPWPQGGFKAEGVFLSAMFYLIVRLSPSYDDKFPRFVLVIIVPALVQSSIGLMQYFGLFPPTTGFFLGYESQVFGTVGGANVLGAFLAGSLPFVYFLIKTNSGRVRILWVLSLFLVLLTLVLTKSRGAWVASVLGLAIYKWDGISYYINMLRTNKLRMILLTFTLSAIAVSSMIAIYNLNPDSASGRLFIWAISRDMFQDNIWTGVGFGNFGLNWLECQGNYFVNASIDKYHLAVNLASAHSQYLHILAETGIVGFCLFMAFILGVLASIGKGLKSIAPKHKPLLVTLTASLVTILVHSLVDDVLRSLIVNLQFMIIIALIALVLNPSKSSMKDPPMPSWSWYRLLFLILAIPLAIYSWHKVEGEILWKEGQDLARTGEWNRGIYKYLEAKKHLPNNYELDFSLGAAYSKIGDAGKAIDLIKKSQLVLSDKNQYIALGKACLDKGEYEQAEESLRQVLRFYPVLLSPHYWLSRCYYEQGDIIRAREELHVILEAENELNSPEIEMVKQDARRSLVAFKGLSVSP